MPRARTDARERAEQRSRTAEQVAAELGRVVGIREAARHRQTEKAQPIPDSVPYRVVGRTVEIDGAECRPLGEVLARVVDLKIVRGGLALFALHTSASEFAHAFTDAALIPRDHPLLLTLDELFPLDEDD